MPQRRDNRGQIDRLSREVADGHADNCRARCRGDRSWRRGLLRDEARKALTSRGEAASVGGFFHFNLERDIRFWR